jgi:hypothetical protein
MAMVQVKRRDFILRFKDFENKEVEIVNKDKVLGVYIPQSLRPDPGMLTESNLERVMISTNHPDRKETADKIVESVMIGKGGKSPPLEETDCRYANAWVSQDSTDNAGKKCPEPRCRNGEYPFEENDQIVWDSCPTCSEIVGPCDICSQPSKELWEHEEEGIERNVCRDCFAVRFDTLDKLERFLKTKRMLLLGPSFDGGKTRSIWMKEADFSDFNPIPKPVKKEKK